MCIGLRCRVDQQMIIAFIGTFQFATYSPDIMIFIIGIPNLLIPFFNAWRSIIIPLEFFIIVYEADTARIRQRVKISTNYHRVIGRQVVCFLKHS